MPKRSFKDYKKRIQTQNLVILALSILIVVMVVVSSTAAWYIRTRSDSADIILSHPVNIYITEDGTQKEDILKDYQTRIYPGDKIKLNLGAQLGDGVVESSPAYVRVKLQIEYENIETKEISTLEDLKNLGQIEYLDAPDPDVWEKVDFYEFVNWEGDPDKKPVDYWYVLRMVDGDGNLKSRIAYDGEKLQFIDGYIVLNKLTITNKQANCKIHINYVVEAIQTKNVPDPLVEKGKGPWWENEDIYWDVDED